MGLIVPLTPTLGMATWTEANHPLNGTGDMVGIVFKASHDFDCTKIGYHIDNKAGTPPTYEVGLYNPSSVTIGYPDIGTAIVSATDTPPSSPTQEYREVSISSTSLTAGQVYWIVIQYDSGTIDNSNRIDVPYAWYYQYQTFFNGGARSTNTGSTWTHIGAGAAFSLHSSSGLEQGFPLMKIASATTSSTDDIFANRVVTKSTRTLEKIYVSGDFDSGPDGVFAGVWDESWTLLEQSRACNADESSSSLWMQEFPLDTPYELTADTAYRIGISYPSTGSGNMNWRYFQVDDMGTMTGLPDNPSDIYRVDYDGTTVTATDERIVMALEFSAESSGGGGGGKLVGPSVLVG